MCEPLCDRPPSVDGVRASAATAPAPARPGGRLPPGPRVRREVSTVASRDGGPAFAPAARRARRRGPPALAAAAALGLALLSTACASTYQRVITPEELPGLEARLERSPGDPEALHRYAAALYAVGRCDDAQAAAARAIRIAPELALGVLVMGRCLEDAGSLDEAVELYTSYLGTHARARGAAAVNAQRTLTLERQAIQIARAALQAEQQGAAAGAADPDAVAILPLVVTGGPEYAPLSRGLASLMISDLNLLARFRLLERVQLEAIVAEITLGQTAAVDPATAARVGRLMSAGRTVQGTVAIDPASETTALRAAVVGGDGTAAETLEQAGGLAALLDLEKNLVLSISEAMGYTPSLAERTRILNNGTRNLAAFLAYSAGLEAAALGDYGAAARHYEQAVRLDPEFEQARGQLGEVRAVEMVASSTPATLAQVAMESDAAVAEALEIGSFAVDGALQNSVLDVAGLEQEFSTLAAGAPAAERQFGSIAGSPSTQGPGGAEPTRPGEFRIIVVIP